MKKRRLAAVAALVLCASLAVPQGAISAAVLTPDETGNGITSEQDAAGSAAETESDASGGAAETELDAVGSAGAETELDAVGDGEIKNFTVKNEAELAEALEAAAGYEGSTEVALNKNISCTGLTIPENTNVIFSSIRVTHTLTQNGTGFFITVESGASLTLKNITVDADFKSPGVFVDKGGALTMESGATIQNGNANVSDKSGNSQVRYAGGGVCLWGSLTMEEGSVISGCTTTLSGSGTNTAGLGVYANNTAVFTMNGGEIADCAGTANITELRGAGVCVANGAKFVMNGGSIHGNTNYGPGAGLYVYGGTAAIGSGTSETEAKIYGNSSLDDKGSGTTGQGTQSENHRQLGSGIYIVDGTDTNKYPANVTIKDGASISGNTLETARYTPEERTTTSGGTNGLNTSYSYPYAYGAGVYLAGGELTMAGGGISGNRIDAAGMPEAEDDADAGSTSDTGEDIMTHYACGAGVYAAGGTFTMIGGTITENTVSSAWGENRFTGNGGGLCIGFTDEDTYPTVNLYGGTITGNTASGNGDDVYVMDAEPTYDSQGNTNMSNGSYEWGLTTASPVVNIQAYVPETSDESAESGQDAEDVQEDTGSGSEATAVRIGKLFLMAPTEAGELDNGGSWEASEAVLNVTGSLLSGDTAVSIGLDAEVLETDTDSSGAADDVDSDAVASAGSSGAADDVDAAGDADADSSGAADDAAAEAASAEGRVVAIPGAGYYIHTADAESLYPYEGSAAGAAGLEVVVGSGGNLSLQAAYTGEKQELTTDNTKVALAGGGSLTYTGDTFSPELSVIWKDSDGNSIELTAGTDYTVVYGTETDAGEHLQVLVYGIGAYTGGIEAKFEINPLNLASAYEAGELTVSGITDKVYSGETFTVEQSAVSLSWNGVPLPNTDYTVSCEGSAGNISESTEVDVKIEGRKNCTGTIKEQFTISPQESGRTYITIDLDAEEGAEGTCASLSDALTALAQDTENSGAVSLLLKNDEELSGTQKVPAGRDITIIGNGHKLTAGEENYVTATAASSSLEGNNEETTDDTAVDETEEGTVEAADTGELKEVIEEVEISNEDAAMFSVLSGGSLTLSDVTLDGSGKERLVYVAENGELTADGGVVLTNGKVLAQAVLGGSIASDDWGVVVKDGKVIIATKEYINNYYGGVGDAGTLKNGECGGHAIWNAGTVNFSGTVEKISYLTDAETCYYGAVYNIGTFTMENAALVTDVYTENGAIYNDGPAAGGGTGTADDGTVAAEDETAAAGDGTVAADGKTGTFTMTDNATVSRTFIRDSVSFTSSSAQAVFNRGTFLMKGGSSLTQNGAAGVSGGKTVRNEGSFTMQDSSSITDNINGQSSDSLVNGGTVYQTAGEFVMEGGSSISDNRVFTDGGAFLITGGTVTVRGGKISGNQAVFQPQSSFNTIPSHVGIGGAVYMNGGTFQIQGGEISGNEAYALSSSGGMVAYDSEKELRITGKVVLDSSTNNKSGSPYGMGGNIFLDGGTLEISGDAVIKDGYCLFPYASGIVVADNMVYDLLGNPIFTLSGNPDIEDVICLEAGETIQIAGKLENSSADGVEEADGAEETGSTEYADAAEDADGTEDIGSHVYTVYQQKVDFIAGKALAVYADSNDMQETDGGLFQRYEYEDWENSRYTDAEKYVLFNYVVDKDKKYVAAYEEEVQTAAGGTSDGTDTLDAAGDGTDTPDAGADGTDTLDAAGNGTDTPNADAAQEGAAQKTAGIYPVRNYDISDFRFTFTDKDGDVDRAASETSTTADTVPAYYYFPGGRTPSVSVEAKIRYTDGTEPYEAVDIGAKLAVAYSRVGESGETSAVATPAELGSYTVTWSANSKFYQGSHTENFRIVPFDLGKANEAYESAGADANKNLRVQMEISSNYYVLDSSGKWVFQPQVKTVKTGLSNVLAAGTDYKVSSYSTTADTGSVTVAGIGNYTGTFTCETPQKTVQTITGQTSFAKKYSDAAFYLGAKTSGSGKLSYVSSNSAVASVNTNGKVTLKGVGTAVITVTAAETAIYRPATASVTITVAKADQTITNVPDTYGPVTYTKKTVTMSATAKGAVTYTSSNTKVVKVNATSGVITFVGAGTATITVKAAATDLYNAASKTMTVTVTRAKQTITAKKASKTYKLSKVKKKKQVFSIGAKTGGNGKLTYAVKKYPKGAKKYIKVTKKGKVTIKKGAKKGTYKIRITAKQTAQYAKATKTITIKVK